MSGGSAAVCAAVTRMAEQQEKFQKQLMLAVGKLAQQQTDATAPSNAARSSAGANQRDDLQNLVQRLDKFEQVLRADRLGAGGPVGPSSSVGSTMGDQSPPASPRSPPVTPRTKSGPNVEWASPSAVNPQVKRVDSPCFGSPPGVGLGAHSAAELPEPTIVTLTRLPHGDSFEGEAEVRESACPGGIKKLTYADGSEEAIAGSVQELIDELLAQATNPHDLILEELKRFKAIATSLWPLPRGYRERLAPAYLAYVYSNGQRAEEHGNKYISEHGLEECFPARELVSILSQVDRLLLVDKEKGFINRVNTEYLCRRAWGLERGFEKCRTKHDWFKPRSGDQKNWRSKVDWDLVSRIDPLAKSQGSATRLQARAVEDEMRAEIDRDAMLLKSRKKLDENQKGIPFDPLNG